MDEWRSYHVYYTDIDRLLLECIGPCLRTLDGSLSMYFWERHYAGGRHVRVRFRGSVADLNVVGKQFVSAVQRYLELYPSARLTNYSSDDARQMLEMEGEVYDPDDLNYRINAICEQQYQRLKSRYVQGEGLELLHEFLHDSNALTVAMLKDPAAKLDNLLSLFFLNALFVDGGLQQGSVSYKSHWSGFAATFGGRPIIERIRRSFEEQKDSIIARMLEVQDAYSRRNFSHQPVLAEWHRLLDKYGRKAKVLLSSGVQISFTMTPHEIRGYRDFVGQHAHEKSEFMQVLLEDERFVAAFRHEQSLAWPRVLVNLLYMIVPALGLTILDRMALCYFAHRGVETHLQCDLTDVLRTTITTTLRNY
ncbi:MAG TPA: lantibiotic dehydratase C-terminal domain-containing protein [Candidatus Sulfotelmatobacter sp.]